MQYYLQGLDFINVLFPVWLTRNREHMYFAPGFCWKDRVTLSPDVTTLPLKVSEGQWVKDNFLSTQTTFPH